MPSGNGFSGKLGTILIGTTPVMEIRTWKFNPKSTNPRYASNRTSGYKRTVAGVKEASGSITGAYDPSTPYLAVIDVGAVVTLLLYMDATHFFSVPSVIDDGTVNVDVDNGEIVSWEASFSSDGAWVNPTAPMVMQERMGMEAGQAPAAPPPPAGQASSLSPEMIAVIAKVAADAALAAVQAAGFKAPTAPAAPPDIAAVAP